MSHSHGFPTTPQTTHLMKISFLLAAAFFVLAHAANAQTRYDLFHKNNRAYDIDPAIEVLVGLTPEQKAKLDAALEVRKNDASVLEAEQELKVLSSKKESPEYASAKDKFDKARGTAKTSYLALVDATLTPEQKDLVAKLQAFSSKIHKEADAKAKENSGDEKPSWGSVMALCREIARPRLDEVLTPEQITLLSNSAAAVPEKN